MSFVETLNQVCSPATQIKIARKNYQRTTFKLEKKFLLVLLCFTELMVPGLGAVCGVTDGSEANSVACTCGSVECTSTTGLFCTALSNQCTLNPVVVGYYQITSGRCETAYDAKLGHKFNTINVVPECSKAAKVLRVAYDTSASATSTIQYNPPGCFLSKTNSYWANLKCDESEVAPSTENCNQNSNTVACFCKFEGGACSNTDGTVASDRGTGNRQPCICGNAVCDSSSGYFCHAATDTCRSSDGTKIDFVATIASTYRSVYDGDHPCSSLLGTAWQGLKEPPYVGSNDASVKMMAACTFYSDTLEFYHLGLFASPTPIRSLSNGATHSGTFKSRMNKCTMQMAITPPDVYSLQIEENCGTNKDCVCRFLGNICDNTDNTMVNTKACLCGKSVCHPLNGLMCDASTSACSFPACDATDGTKICSCGTTSSTSSSSVCTSNTGYVCAATTGTCSFPACAGTETTGKCECGMSTCGSDTGFRCNAATSTCSFPLCTNSYGILPINDVDGGPECLCTSEREDDEGASCITHDGTYNQHRYNPYCRIQAVGNSKCSTFRTKMNPIVVCNACITTSLHPELECRPPWVGSDQFYEACLCGESTVCAGRLGNGCDVATSTCKVEECYSVDSSFDNRVSCRCGTATCDENTGTFCMKTKNKCSKEKQFLDCKEWKDGYESLNNVQNSNTCQCGASVCGDPNLDTGSSYYCKSSSSLCAASNVPFCFNNEYDYNNGDGKKIEAYNSRCTCSSSTICDSESGFFCADGKCTHTYVEPTSSRSDGKDGGGKDSGGKEGSGTEVTAKDSADKNSNTQGGSCSSGVLNADGDGCDPVCDFGTVNTAGDGCNAACSTGDVNAAGDGCEDASAKFIPPGTLTEAGDFTSSEQAGDDTGVIVGVVIGSLVFVGVAVAAAVYVYTTRTKNQTTSSSDPAVATNNEMELSNIKNEQTCSVENPLEKKEKTKSSGWEAHMDEGSGCMYYSNEMSGETTWDKPPSFSFSPEPPTSI